MALATDGSPRDVAVSVLGVPPARLVVPWEDATIAGLSVTSLIDEPGRRRLRNQVAALWPPGPYSLGAAATKTVEALLGRTRSILCCFLAPDERTKGRARTVALPVRLSSEGIEAEVLPELSVADRVALDNAMLL